MADLALKQLALLVRLVLAVAAVVLTIVSTEPLWVVLVWGLLIAAGQLVAVPTPSGDRLFLGLAPAVAMPLLFHEPAAIGAAYALGLVGSWVSFELTDQPIPEARAFTLAETVGLTLYAFSFLSVTTFLEGNGVRDTTAHLLAFACGAVAWFAATSLTRALIAYEEQGLAFRYQWLRALGDWPVALSLLATGGLFGFAYPDMGWWALPVAALPYGFSHVSFVRFHGTRVTYGQTIRALAKIPEVAGLAIDGHSARTSDLAVAIAQELGVRPEDVIEIEYAALMHDIGRITLNEPAIIKAGYTDEDIARWGSQIIAEAPYLHRVAEYVAQQHEPYRRPGEETDATLPVASKIIKVSSAYDQAVTETGLPAIEAVEVLHRGAAYDFDPKVVTSLRRVISRRGDIAV